MRAGPGLGCGLLRAAGRTRALRGPQPRSVRLRLRPHSPAWPGLAWPGGPGWPLPSAARPGRHCPSRRGLLHALRGLAPARPPAPPSSACPAFSPALVRHSVSFVRVRSPDRLLGRDGCILKALSSPRILLTPALNGLQAPFAGQRRRQACHSSPLVIEGTSQRGWGGRTGKGWNGGPRKWLDVPGSLACHLALCYPRVSPTERQ